MNVHAYLSKTRHAQWATAHVDFLLLLNVWDNDYQ